MGLKRRQKKLNELSATIQQDMLNTARGTQSQFLSAVGQPLSELETLGQLFRQQAMTPFSQTVQGQGLVDIIEGQSEQAQERLAEQSDLLGLSDEAYLSGTQQIADSEQKRLQSLFSLGESSRQNALRGYGNILNNLIGVQESGFRLGLGMAQQTANQARLALADQDRARSELIGEGVDAVVDITQLALSQGGGGTTTTFPGYSDIRLKKNISRVGKSAQGHNIYTFEYIDKDKFGHGLYRGVMAQELESHSVRRDSNGYYKVNYDTIDVNFERIK
mgnify:CR=1 FL=1|tara:strand:+ start:1021 stop:1848 length:828 start_codon:yes stop_codon:yes gene_type:complete